MINNLNIAQLRQLLASKKYIDPSLTIGVPLIVGIRLTTEKINSYNDWAYVYYKDDAGEVLKVYQITTVPGLDYLEHPIAGTSGTAVLVPGQYKSWILGLHRGTQEALIQQAGEVYVYRDDNKDATLSFDPKTIDHGFFGIDLHHAGPLDTGVVGKWSAGCQVWRNHQEHIDMINVFKILSSKYKFKDFTYTLFNEADVRAELKF